MRRMIAGAKKVLHRNQRQNDPPQNNQVQLDQSQSGQTVFNLSLSPGPPGGYTCWDHTQCGLCSRFLDRWFILNMFTSKFVDVGKTTDLLTWSQAGGRCALCNYISLRFIEETRGEIPLDASIIVRWDTRDTAIKDGRRDEVPSFNFELSWGYQQGNLEARSARLKCFTNEDQKMAHYMTARPANPDISSPAAFAKAKTWLAECIDWHTQCQRASPGSSEMPSRVLEISPRENDNYSIRLHETTGEIASYVALSYIWGGPQTCQTLKSNFDEHIQQIDAKKLPRTIMDAVYCTQKLGLKYLWVDSLCIIQDSLEDKSKEIGRMSGIYKNAYVTISAAKATSCEGGFLEPRATVQDLLKTSFKLEILTPKDPVALNEWVEQYCTKHDSSNFMLSVDVEAIFKTSAWNHPDAWYDTPSTVWLAATPLGGGKDLLTADDIKDEPISKRGWTMQESWLSPRMLIYGSRQLLWKCSGGVQVDGGVTGLDTGWDIKTRYQIDEDGDVAYKEGGKVDESGKEFYFGALWQDIVREYSRRALTVAGDKLNALEGIVQELRRQTEDEYLAGLWKQRLVSELSWYQDATHNGFEPLLWNTERTCPSWSWIKTDGPVSFSHAENSSVVVKDAKVVRNEMVGEYPNSRLVVEGAITLRAPISTLPIEQVLPNFTFQAPGSSRLAFTNLILPDGALTNPEFMVKTINGESQIGVPPDMRFLELSWGKKGGSQNIANESRGLVLVPVNMEGRKNVFQRVGFFVVALEEDLERDNIVGILSFEPRNVKATEFGGSWRACLKEEVVVVI